MVAKKQQKCYYDAMKTEDVTREYLAGTLTSEEARDLYDVMLNEPGYDLPDLPEPLQQIADEITGPGNQRTD